MANTTIKVFEVKCDFSELPKVNPTKSSFSRKGLKERLTKREVFKVPYVARTNIGLEEGVFTINAFEERSGGSSSVVVLRSNKPYKDITVSFNAFTREKFTKVLENVINEYKFAESENTKELHKQIDQTELDIQGYKKRIEKLEQQLAEAKQDARDERSKGITDYMRYEREISAEQKAKENAQKEIKVLTTALMEQKTQINTVKQECENDIMPYLVKLTRKGYTDEQIKKMMVKKGYNINL